MNIVYKLDTWQICGVLSGTLAVTVADNNFNNPVTGEYFINCAVATITPPENFTEANANSYYFDPSLGVVHTKRYLPLEAYDRLTAQERIAIRSLAATDPVVKDWLHRFDIVAYQNTPFEIGPGSNWYSGMKYLNSTTPVILTDERLKTVTNAVVS